MLDRLALYARTLRYLRPAQVVSLARRRITPGVITVRNHPDVRFRHLQHLDFCAAPVKGTRERFRFVGLDCPIDIESFDWICGDMPRLWRYNLHYFDYLGSDTLSVEDRGALIDSWIEANPPGRGEGWEPYPLSLRIVNWIKFLLGPGAQTLNRDRWCASLAHQAAWLSRNIEYHLLANHILKNAKALVFAGAFFDGRDADDWRARGLDLLLAEADEQVLGDGGHFERSPMYHCIVLEDLLDTVNLLKANAGLTPDAARASLAAAATRAGGFLAGIIGGDGRIPLFNDSAFGIAPEPAGLLAYASRVLGGSFPVIDHPRLDFPVTGYFGYRRGRDSLLIDCGPVGPDYQPGHAHCDTLSYELCLDGRRVVVDAGVSGYDGDPLRHYVRSTAAHNTVCIDGLEQSEIWGTFRVARRARPVSATIEEQEDGTLTFIGAHDGYRRGGLGITHERRIETDRARRWRVFDLITGPAGRAHAVESFIHLAPKIAAEAIGAGVWRLRSADGGLLLRLSVTPGTDVVTGTGYYCPEFGAKTENSVLTLRRRGRLPIELDYMIERI